ncbi:hypothetical protein OKW96_11445 [Sphingobacterium sp. KU25419]|nr:hypothetical protein OKW96_11445 [Sphingobacterium sp. KU25419]
MKIGDSLNFSFELQNLHNQAQLVRLEYGIYYLKANGQLSRKVFKISEKYIKLEKLKPYHVINPLN